MLRMKGVAQFFDGAVQRLCREHEADAKQNRHPFEAINLQSEAERDGDERRQRMDATMGVVGNEQSEAARRVPKRTRPPPSPG